MRKCYISGPMRGVPEFNFPAFEEAAAKLRKKGWLVFSPAEFDAQFHTTGDKVTVLTYIRRDLHIIVNELGAADAIVLLPNWQESIGDRDSPRS